MSNRNPERTVFHAEAYMRPDNVHTKEDGSVVAWGPHGSEFPVSSVATALIIGIERGLLLDYPERSGQWQQAHEGPEVWEPQDSCA